MELMNNTKMDFTAVTEVEPNAAMLFYILHHLLNLQTPYCSRIFFMMAGEMLSLS